MVIIYIQAVNLYENIERIRVGQVKSQRFFNLIHTPLFIREKSAKSQILYRPKPAALSWRIPDFSKVRDGVHPPSGG